MFKKFISKFQRIPIIYVWAIIIGVFILLIGIFSSRLFTKLANEDEKLQLIEQTNLVKSVINTNELLEFSVNQSDTTKESFKTLQYQLINFCNSAPQIRYIYLLGKKEDKLFFYLDTESDSNKLASKRKTALPGEEYTDAPPLFRQAIDQKKQIIIGPYHDQWGDFVSIISPIYNNKNNIIAYIGIDVDANNWYDAIRSKKMVPIIVSLIFIAILTLASVFLRYRIDSEGNIKEMYYRLTYLYKNSKQPIILFTSDYRVVYFNNEAINISTIFLNHSIKIGKKITECIASEEHKKNFINNTKLLLSQNRLTVPIIHENRSFALEYSYIQPNEFANSFICLVINDISEQTDLKEQISRLKSEISAISDSYQYSSICFDDQLKIFEINHFFEEKYGYDQQELIDKKIDFLVHPNSMINITSNLILTSSEEIEFQTINFQIVAKNGEQHHTQGKLIKSFTSTNKLVYALIIFDDVYINNRIDELQHQLTSSKRLIDNLPGFIYRCKNDRNWTMLYLSYGFENLTGYTVENVIKNNRISYNDLIFPKYREYLFDKWQDCLKNRSIFEDEYEIITAKGEQIWVLERGFGVYDDDNNVIEIEGFITEITELKSANNLIISENDKLRSYIHRAPEGIIQMDKDGHILKGNIYISTLTEYEIDELRSLKFASLIGVDSFNKYIVFQKKLIDHGQATEEVTIICKSGNIKQIRIKAIRVESNDFFLCIVDNTEQFKIKSQIHYLESILDSISSPISIINVNNRSIVHGNNYLEKLIQGNTSCCLGMNPRFSATCCSHGNVCLIEKVLLSKHEEKKDISITDEYGNLVYYELIIKPLFNEFGEIEEVVEYMNDITERETKQIYTENMASKAEFSNKSKSEFLANMSHEIRTPINGIIGVTELMMKNNLNEAQIKHLSIINESSHNLLYIINNILDFSKIEVGKINIINEPFNLEDIIESVLMLFVPMCEEKGIELQFFANKELPKEVVSDEISLRQILINIIGNAVKYTDNGFVKVAVSLAQTSFLEIEISDTGKGIPSDKIEFIFENFTQLDYNSKKGNVATGLGLAISKKIISLLNGSISVKSKLGKGSTFNVSIPIENTQAYPIQPILSKNKILAIISNDTERESFSNFANILNLEIQTCKNGIEALQICDSLSSKDDFFNVVLFDYYSEGLNLTDTVNRIDKLTSKHILFFLICKQNDLSTIEKNGVPNQIREILTKPVLPKHLISVLKKELDRKNQKSNVLNIVHLNQNTTILIAEDNTINMLLIKEILSSTGANIIEATDGQEAYQKFLLHNPDLIFLDIHMPIMDGIEVAKQIQEFCFTNQNHKTPYIIALTADIIKNKKEDYFQFGMNDYISKPYKIEDINISLKNYLKFENDEI